MKVAILVIVENSSISKIIKCVFYDLFVNFMFHICLNIIDDSQ